MTREDRETGTRARGTDRERAEETGTATEPVMREAGRRLWRRHHDLPWAGAACAARDLARRAQCLQPRPSALADRLQGRWTRCGWQTLGHSSSLPLVQSMGSSPGFGPGGVDTGTGHDGQGASARPIVRPRPQGPAGARTSPGGIDPTRKATAPVAGVSRAALGPGAPIEGPTSGSYTRRSPGTGGPGLHRAPAAPGPDTATRVDSPMPAEGGPVVRATTGGRGIAGAPPHGAPWIPPSQGRLTAVTASPGVSKTPGRAVARPVPTAGAIRRASSPAHHEVARDGARPATVPTAMDIARDTGAGILRRHEGMLSAAPASAQPRARSAAAGPVTTDPARPVATGTGRGHRSPQGRPSHPRSAGPSAYTVVQGSPDRPGIRRVPQAGSHASGAGRWPLSGADAPIQVRVEPARLREGAPPVFARSGSSPPPGSGPDAAPLIGGTMPSDGTGTEGPGCLTVHPRAHPGSSAQPATEASPLGVTVRGRQGPAYTRGGRQTLPAPLIPGRTPGHLARHGQPDAQWPVSARTGSDTRHSGAVPAPAGDPVLSGSVRSLPLRRPVAVGPGGANTGAGIHALGAAPTIQRQSEGTASSAPEVGADTPTQAGPGSPPSAIAEAMAPGSPPEPPGAIDLQRLAQEVYELMEERLNMEREALGL